VFWEEGEIELPRCSKTLLAKQLVEIIIQRYFPNASPPKEDFDTVPPSYFAL
jgi:hypothetical protein